MKRDFNIEKAIGDLPYSEVRAVSFDNPPECIFLNLSETKLAEQLIPILKEFFKPGKDRTNYYNFKEVYQEEGMLSVTVEGLKGAITKGYFEKVALELRWRSREIGTSLCFDLSAEYASGFRQPGKYINLKDDYFREFITYQQNLKQLLVKLK